MKATAAEVEVRTAKVAEWLASGWSRARICENVREIWELSDSQADRYIAKARELMRDSYQPDWAANLAMADARLESQN